MAEVESGGRRPFAAFLQEQRGGALHGELSDALAELVQAVQDTGKNGTLTLAIKVESNKDEVTVTVSDKVTLKAPEPEPARGAAIFFIQGDGNLVRRDPRQQEIPGLREVDTDTGEVRELAGAGGAL